MGPASGEVPRKRLAVNEDDRHVFLLGLFNEGARGEPVDGVHDQDLVPRIVEGIDCLLILGGLLPLGIVDVIGDIAIEFGGEIRSKGLDERVGRIVDENLGDSARGLASRKREEGQKQGDFAEIMLHDG